MHISRLCKTDRADLRQYANARIEAAKQNLVAAVYEVTILQRMTSEPAAQLASTAKYALHGAIPMSQHEKALDATQANKIREVLKREPTPRAGQ